MTGGARATALRTFTGALQSALTMTEVLDAYLRSVDSMVGADALGVYELDRAGDSMVRVTATVGDRLISEYEEYGRGDDPMLRVVTGQLRPIDSSRVVERAQWEACGAHQALRIEDLVHSLEAPLVVDGALYGTLNFARAAHRPAFDRQDLAAATIVGEQLGLAIGRAQRCEANARRSSALEEALERIGQAVVVTDLDGLALFVNRAAADWGVGVDGIGRLSQGAIARAVDAALAEFRRHGKKTHLARIVVDGRRAILKSYRRSERDRTAITLVFACPDARAPQLPVWEVLTRREQEIAQLVSQGLTTRQIAAQSFISENTVKQHLKRVFAKTDVSSRAELVQLIWTAGRADDRR